MLYLGRKWDKDEMKSTYQIMLDPKNLESFTKLLPLDKSIPVGTLDKLLQLLNGEGTYYIEEKDEITLANGVGIQDHTYYNTIFGEIEEKLEHEGPYFKGLNGETRGYFSYYTVTPKTDLAIVVKETSTMWYSKMEEKTCFTKRGEIYFLKKKQAEKAVETQVV